MAIRNTSAEHSSAGRAVLIEAYRRTVEIDAALTEATTVDPYLHRWCEERLGELLDLLEPFVDDAPEPTRPANE